MLNPEDILNILEERVKPYLKKQSKPFAKDERPDYYEGYEKFVAWREGLLVHADPDKFPAELLANRAPNQTEREWEYMKANYKNTTMPVCMDYLSTVGRAWSDNNWAIDYNEDEGQYSEQSFREYVEKTVEDTPLKMSVEMYYKTVFPYVKMVDSMGCIVIKPYFIPTVETEDGPVMAGDQLLQPVPFYYPVNSLVALEEGVFYMFRIKEKSIVEYNGKPVKEGIIYEVYDDTNIWRVIQVGKKIDYNFEVELYYTHSGDAIPVSRCKGVPVPGNDETVWQSRLMSVKGLLDNVILDDTYLKVIKASSTFPYKVMVGNICENKMELNGEIQPCENGYFHDLTQNKSIQCSACNGTGLQNRIAPGGVMLLHPETPSKEGEMKASQPAMYYVSPSTETMDLLRKEIDTNLEKSRGILHLQTSTSEVKGSQDITATGKALDMKALYAFVKSDADQTFSEYEWALTWIGYMRYGDSFKGFTLTYPQSFDFYTEYDYLNQVSEAIKNGLPPFLVQSTIMKYMKSLWSNDMVASKSYDLIMETDRLMAMDDDEVNMKKAQGIVADWEIVLHDSGLMFINELYIENPNFFEQDVEVQKEQLIQRAKDKTVAIKPNAVDTILNDSIITGQGQ